MSTVLTLVASNISTPLTDKHVKDIINILGYYDVKPTCQPVWIKNRAVVEIGITGHGGQAMMNQLHEHLHADAIDVFITPIENRRKKLVLADMDSTIVTGETLDDLAAHAGIKDQIAEITERAMNGELDFHAAIRERVSLLKGLGINALDKTRAELKINPQAENFIMTMRKHNAFCVLVSGGFTFFTETVAEKLRFNAHHGNELEIDNDKLTGHVVPPILDKNAKVEFLKLYMNRYNLKTEDCLTIGDGAIAIRNQATQIPDNARAWLKTYMKKRYNVDL